MQKLKRGFFTAVQQVSKQFTQCFASLDLKCQKESHTQVMGAPMLRPLLTSLPPPHPAPPPPLPANCITQHVMPHTNLYQLRPAVIAPGFCMPAIMPSCSHIGPSTSAASLVAKPSIILPDAMACSPRPGTSSSSMYLYQVQILQCCRNDLVGFPFFTIGKLVKLYFYCCKTSRQVVVPDVKVDKTQKDTQG